MLIYILIGFLENATRSKATKYKLSFYTLSIENEV